MLMKQDIPAGPNSAPPSESQVGLAFIRLQNSQLCTQDLVDALRGRIMSAMIPAIPSPESAAKATTLIAVDPVQSFITMQVGACAETQTSLNGQLQEFIDRLTL